MPSKSISPRIISDARGCVTPSDRAASEVLALHSTHAVHIIHQPSVKDRIMAMLTIRNLDPSLKERLRVRAAQHGHSMEAEARDILRTTLTQAAQAPERNLYDRIRARFAPLGGVDLDLPPREPARDPPRFD